MFVFVRDRRNHYFFEYLSQKLRELKVKVQESQLFSAQATLTHSPAIMAQALLSETELLLSTFYRYTKQSNLILYVLMKYHK